MIHPGGIRAKHTGVAGKQFTRAAEPRIDAYAQDRRFGRRSLGASLVFGFVRGKSSGLIAPAILHGLPQAIAYAVLGL